MGLETVDENGNARIHQLREANPLGTDNKNQGDDHIRNIKKVIKDQFSGIASDTSSPSVVATATELNHLDGVTSNIQTQIDAISGGSVLPSISYDSNTTTTTINDTTALTNLKFGDASIQTTAFTTDKNTELTTATTNINSHSLSLTGINTDITNLQNSKQDVINNFRSSIPLIR